MAGLGAFEIRLGCGGRGLIAFCIGGHGQNSLAFLLKELSGIYPGHSHQGLSALVGVISPDGRFVR